MKMQKKVNASTIIEVEGITPKDVFEGIARLEDFAHESVCGACQGTNLQYVVREAKGFKFYEIRCTNRECGAKLSLGQSKENDGLFPKRKAEDGTWKENGGWEKWHASA